MSQNPRVALSALEDGLSAPTLESAIKIWADRLGIPVSSANQAKQKVSLTNFEYFQHQTISRDQTAESNYELEQLLVLGSRAADEQVHEPELTSKRASWREVVCDTLDDHPILTQYTEEKTELSIGSTGENSETNDTRYFAFPHNRSHSKSPSRSRARQPIDFEPVFYSRTHSLASSSNSDRTAVDEDSQINVSSNLESTLEPISQPAREFTSQGTFETAFGDEQHYILPTLIQSENMESKYQALQIQIENLKTENRKLRDLISAPEPPSVTVPEPPQTTIQILHRLADDKVSLYRPTWILGEKDERRLHLDMPLKDVTRFLTNHSEIAFAVYKDYRDEESPALGSTSPQEPNAEAETVQPPEPSHESIKLVSGRMIEAFKAFVKELPDFEKSLPGFDISKEILAPYLFWYNYRSRGDEVFALLSSQHGELMTLLTEWIERSCGPEYEKANELWTAGLVSKKFMKYLIRPGDVLVSRDDDGFLTGTMCTSWTKWLTEHKESPKDAPESSRRANVEVEYRTAMAMKDPFSQREQSPDMSQNKVGSINEYRRTQSFGHSNESGELFIDEYVVKGWRWAYDGSFFSKNASVRIQLQRSHHEEEVEIRSLNSYPIDYADEDIRTILKRRAQTFRSFQSSHLVEYHEESWHTVSVEIERYMIDYATYYKLHFEKPGILKHTICDATFSSNLGQTYVFPPQVKGYNLLRKRWVDLDVDNIRPVNWNKKAFDSLVLDSDTKELVKALVMTHLEAENGTDIIGGKGNGLIMLLHGGPGTGKTFTAETVAEIAEKPLYRVTCGDIGTQPDKVEKYLESVLNLGKIWGCLVLLDEADVFLEERSLSQLDRNALVSVFLRVLEYYEGILILTSNRVGTFDEAFKSRIQLALHYPNLELPQKRRIWGNFLERLKGLDAKALNYDSLCDQIDVLAAHDMNGREIRNVITTARQLAKFRNNQILDFELLAHVIKISGKFDAYLRDVKKGLTDDDIARSMSNR